MILDELLWEKVKNEKVLRNKISERYLCFYYYGALLRNVMFLIFNFLSSIISDNFP